jgi:hypothetical protein
MRLVQCQVGQPLSEACLTCCSGCLQVAYWGQTLLMAGMGGRRERARAVLAVCQRRDIKHGLWREPSRHISQRNLAVIQVILPLAIFSIDSLTSSLSSLVGCKVLRRTTHRCAWRKTLHVQLDLKVKSLPCVTCYMPSHCKSNHQAHKLSPFPSTSATNNNTFVSPST